MPTFFKSDSIPESVEDSLTVARPVGTIVLNGGVMYESTNATVATYSAISSPSAVPAGVITVATSGGDHTTIAAGLAAASSGDAVVVYPGTYSENITIPAGVRLVGYPAAFAVVIDGADTTGTRVTLNNGSTLREFTVVGPSSGANPCIDASAVTTSCVLFTVTTQGGGGTGPMIDGPTTGTIAINLLAHNGGTVGGAFLDMSDGGEVRMVAGGMNLNAGQSDEIIKLGGTAVFRGQNITVRPAYVATDFIEVGGTAECQIVGVIMPDQVSPNVTNGIHITADGVTVNVSSADIKASAFDILVDGALAGTGTALTLTGAEFSLERVSLTAAFATTAEVNVSYLDRGVQNDSAFRVGTELSVGSILAPREAAFGEGDSGVGGMQVWVFDASAGTWTDRTTEAKSATGSTFAMLGDVGDKLVIGHTGKFPNMRYTATIAAVLGSGAFDFQVWDGAALQTLPFMVTQASSPYNQLEKSLFQAAESQQCRFGTDDTASYGAWTARDPSGAGTLDSIFWLEITVITANLTTPATFQRFKIGNNRTEINSDGFSEFFGAAEPSRPLMVHQRLTDDLSGASPANGALAMTSNITITPVDNRFSSSALDGFGWNRRVPAGQDTSRLITFTCLYALRNTNTGNIFFRFRYGVNELGGTIDGTTTDTTLTALHAGTGTNNQLREVQFQFRIENSVPGDVLSFSFARDGTDASDTYTGNVDVVLIEAEGVFWH